MPAKAVSRVELAPSAGVAERPAALSGSQAQPGAGIHRTAPDSAFLCVALLPGRLLL